ncbi:MAG: hypothetical protein FJ149_02380 [Euryarchaeota archaeon]|nr:hypothetical protein [Euryarchaeota archaeon]
MPRPPLRGWCSRPVRAWTCPFSGIFPCRNDSEGGELDNDPDAKEADGRVPLLFGFIFGPSSYNNLIIQYSLTVMEAMSNPDRNKKIDIHIKHPPNPDDQIDGRPYSWWMEQISKLDEVYSCSLKDPECLERYNETVACLKKCLKMVILLRWILISRDSADKTPPNIPPLDTSIFSNPKPCIKCGTPHVPLYNFIPNLPSAASRQVV